MTLDTYLAVQNHERDSPFTGDRYMNGAADSGGVLLLAKIPS